MEFSLGLIRFLAALLATSPTWLGTAQRLSPKEVMAPTTKDTVLRFLCTVPSGHTARYELGGHQLTKDDPVNMTESNNSLILSVDNDGLDHFGVVDGANKLTVGCCKVDYENGFLNDWDCDWSYILRFGIPDEPGGLRVDHHRNVHFQRPRNMGKGVLVMYTIIVKNLEFHNQTVYTVKDKKKNISFKVKHGIPYCYSVVVTAENLAGTSQPVSLNHSQPEFACSPNVRRAEVYYTPGSFYANLTCSLEEWSPANHCVWTNEQETLTVPKDGLCIEKERLGNGTTYGSDQNGEKIGYSSNVKNTLVEDENIACSSTNHNILCSVGVVFIALLVVVL